ncbi:unnamed protein product [Phytophthora fragariaefolia]|uniref:Unnamed protein product n=1 Tax=Phytophthora fragariaefolia TaxID=1490495 RepID=A0A9W6YFF2_9STRA|nr:unnamed protein product [Phytophthora fragariaefolia]
MLAFEYTKSAAVVGELPTGAAWILLELKAFLTALYGTANSPWRDDGKEEVLRPASFPRACENQSSPSCEMKAELFSGGYGVALSGFRPRFAYFGVCRAN